MGCCERRHFGHAAVRPGSIRAILDHLVPSFCTRSMMSWSSSSVHSSLLMEGHTWLCHLRAHARRMGAGKGEMGRRPVLRWWWAREWGEWGE